MPVFSTERIPYQEFRAINDLRRSHPRKHERSLRAMIAFGDLVSDGSGLDIQLLEVVDGWSGPRRVSFSSTSELPLRGRLTVYFLLPSEFEHPSQTPAPGERWSSAELVHEVQAAYAVLFERV